MNRLLRPLLAALPLLLATGPVAAQQGFSHQPLAGAPSIGASLSPGFVDHLWVSGTYADRGLGFTRSYMSVGAVQGFYIDQFDGWWFVEGRGHVSEEGKFFSNLGLGRRFYFSPERGDVGLSVWYDYDDDRPEEFGHVFHQVGVSADMRFEHWDLAINGYIPVGSSQFLEDIESFQGHNIFIPARDSALSGYDITWTYRPPKLQHINGRIDLGVYAYKSRLVDGFAGFHFGVGFQPWQGVDINCELNHDDNFDTTGIIRVALHFGANRGYSPTGRGTEPTRRNDHIVREWNPTLIAINPATMAPWYVVHVSFDEADPIPANRDGTREFPYALLSEAEGNSSPNDMIFVWDNPISNTVYDEGITLQDEQFFLANGIAHVIPVVSGKYRSFQLQNDIDPARRPTISAPVGTPVVQLASANRVAGFLIDGQGNASIGIYGNGITAADLRENDIFDTVGQAVFIENSFGRIDFRNNIVTNTGAEGYWLDNHTGSTVVQDNLFDGTGLDSIAVTNSALNSRFQRNEITNSGGAGIVMANVTGTRNEILDNEIDTTAADGIALANVNTDMRIQRNIIANTAADGIFSAVTAGRLSITDNQIGPTGGDGIFGALVSGRLEVLRNTITGTTGDGIAYVDVANGGTFQGNVLNAIGGDGIYIEQAAGTVSLNTNQIDTTGGAGMFVNLSTATFSILTNTIANTTLEGIFILDSNGAYEIRQNAITAAGTDGLSVFASTNSSYNLNLNTITGAGGRGMAFVEVAAGTITSRTDTITGSALQGLHLVDSFGVLNITGANILNNGTGLGLAGVHVEMDANSLAGVIDANSTLITTIESSVINNNGAGVFARAVGLVGVAGGPTMETRVRNFSTVNANESHGIHAQAESGATHTLIVRDSNVNSNGTAAGGGVGIFMELHGVAADGFARMNAFIQGNWILNNAGIAAVGPLPPPPDQAPIPAGAQANYQGVSGIYAQIGDFTAPLTPVAEAGILNALIENNFISGAGTANAGADDGMHFDLAIDLGLPNATDNDRPLWPFSVVELNNNTIQNMTNDGIEFQIMGPNAAVSIIGRRNLIQNNGNAAVPDGDAFILNMMDTSIARLDLRDSIFQNHQWKTMTINTNDTAWLVIDRLQNMTLNTGLTGPGIQAIAADNSVMVLDLFDNQANLNGWPGMLLIVDNNATMLARIFRNRLLNNGGLLGGSDLELQMRATATPAARLAAELRNNSTSTRMIFANLGAGQFDVELGGNSTPGTPIEIGVINRGDFDIFLDSLYYRQRITP